MLSGKHDGVVNYPRVRIINEEVKRAALEELLLL